MKKNQMYWHCTKHRLDFRTRAAMHAHKLRNPWCSIVTRMTNSR